MFLLPVLPLIICMKKETIKTLNQAIIYITYIIFGIPLGLIFCTVNLAFVIPVYLKVLYSKIKKVHRRFWKTDYNRPKFILAFCDFVIFTLTGTMLLIL